MMTHKTTCLSFSRAGLVLNFTIILRLFTPGTVRTLRSPARALVSHLDAAADDADQEIGSTIASKYTKSYCEVSLERFVQAFDSDSVDAAAITAAAKSVTVAHDIAERIIVSMSTKATDHV